MKITRVLPVLALLAVVGCRPEADNLRLLDELVVSTNYDPEADFRSFNTFALATDTIGFVSNRTRDTLLTYEESSLVRPILNQVRSNLVDRGYTRVERREDPQLAVNVYIVNDINLFQQVVYPNYYYPNYWGYSNSFFYGYPLIQTFQQNTGSLVIELVDLVNRNQNNQVRVIWTAYMGDIINTVDREKQILEGIDQAFSQSPYVSR